MNVRLGVNIDHVATLRQQRGESYPSVSRAADMALQAGADQITIHLREDRRHIQDSDLAPVHDLCRHYGKPLNLEIGCDPDIVEIACREKPEWVCLVPEKRQERITEGGLALSDELTWSRVLMAVNKLAQKSSKTKVSLFVEANPATLERCLKLPIHAVEIHTGEYAKDFLEGKEIKHHLVQYAQGHKIIKSAGRGYHAGHGLTNESLKPLIEASLFEEYNIGHWIVGESLFRGMGPVVQELCHMLKKG